MLESIILCDSTWLAMHRMEEVLSLGVGVSYPIAIGKSRKVVRPSVSTAVFVRVHIPYARWLTSQ